MKILWNKSDKTDVYEPIVLGRSFYDEFWQGFRTYLSDNFSQLNPQENLYDLSKDYYKENKPTRSYCGFNFGHFEYDKNSYKPPVWMTAVCDEDYNTVSAQFCFSGKSKRDKHKYMCVLKRFYDDRNSISNQFPIDIEWQMIDFAYRIGITMTDANINDKSNHLNIYKWLQFNLETLQRFVMWKLSSYYIDMIPSLPLGQIRL